MLSVKLVLCVVLAACCAAAIPLSEYDESEIESAVLYESTDIKSFEAIESQNLTNGNGFHIGYLHAGSAVAQSSFLFVNGIANNFATGVYSYNGTRPITYITAFDQNVNGTGGYVFRVDGGVLQNSTVIHFRSSILGGAINFLVTVYVEGSGNNLVLGTLTTNSVLLYERSVLINGLPNQIFTSTVNVVFDNLRPITFIEVIDRTTNGTGGTATITTGGLNQTQVTISIQSSAAGRGINSHIIIHGATRTSTNDFRAGRFNVGNIVLNTQRLFVPAILNQRVSGNVFFNGNRAITLIQGLAVNGNASAGNMIAIGGGINTNSTTLVFESIIGGFIDFTVSIFG